MQFSPGILQGSMALLDVLSRRALTVPEIHAVGGSSVGPAISAAFFLRWISVNLEGVAVATPEGERVRSVEGYEQRLRQAILDYIDAAAPAWVQTASFGRKRLLSFAGNQIGQVFLEAGLVNGTDEAVVAFWDALAARARGQKDDRLNAIGREGERLSLAYERQRTGRPPKWVAIDNNDDGYDILSVVSADDLRKQSIEVKASTLGLRGSFFLTRNEWERALEAEQHAFHVWSLATTPPLLAVLDAQTVGEHVAADRGSGVWKSIEIPLSAFRLVCRRCIREPLASRCRTCGAAVLPVKAPCRARLNQVSLAGLRSTLAAPCPPPLPTIRHPSPRAPGAWSGPASPRWR